MADLLDRIAGTDPTRPKIRVHQFFGGLRLYADGTLTAGEAAQDFDLQGSELTQVNLLVAAIDSKIGIEKLAYVLRVEAVCMKLEDREDTVYHNPDGTIDKTRVAADLEI